MQRTLDRTDWIMLATIVAMLVANRFVGGRVQADDAPIKVDVAKVLFIYETEGGRKPDVISDVEAAGKLNTWLKKHVGEYHFRTYDQNTGISRGDQWVIDALAYYAANGEGVIPWLLVVTPDGGFAGPCPKGVDEVIALIEGVL